MSIATKTRDLTIQSGQGPYEANFYDTIPETIDSLLLLPKAVALVDENVAHLYASDLARLRDAMPVRTVAALETEKTLAGIERTLEFLQENGANRDTRLVAIGGGIIQDIATFASHIYYRGIRFVFVPTTLLSMADSCIGAKCGINFNRFKNQLGVFHAPARVAVCQRFLDTLSDADVVSGYGEIVKLALTGSEDDWRQVERAVTAHGFRNPELADLVSLSLGVKKRVIEEDEYEHDLRRILNYGHTFGHALEAITAHAVPHGVAVAWGLDLANFIAARRGTLDGKTFQRIHDFVARHFSTPCRIPVTAPALIDASRRDKKNTRGKLTMILLARPGKLVIDYLGYDQILEETIARFLDLNHAFFGN